MVPNFTAPACASPATNIEAMLPDGPDMLRQTKKCAKCKLYAGTFLPPRINLRMVQADLVIVTDAPTKQDIRNSVYLSEEPGIFLMNSLQPYTDITRCAILPAIRCFMQRVNAKTPEARTCWTASGMDAAIAAFTDQSTRIDHPKRILALGYWPVKLITGKELKEVHGQIIEIGDAKVACLYSPAYFKNKNVKYTKDSDGRWMLVPPNGMDKAREEWQRHAAKPLANLFSTSETCVVNTDDRIRFPFVRVDEHDEMVRRLRERKGKLAHLDVETYASEEAKAQGLTALDWFYGPHTCMPLCAGFSFFDSLEQTGYMDRNNKPDYDPNLVPVYTGPWTKELADAMNDTLLYAFNANYDTGTMLVHTGVPLDIYADPCDMGYVLNQTRKSYSLASLALEYAPAWASWGDAIKGKTKDYSDIPRPILWNYNAGDNAVSSVLFFRFQRLIKEKHLENAYWTIHAGTKTILRDMEARGVRVDARYWKQLCDELTRDRQNALDTMFNCESVMRFRRSLVTPDNLNPEFNPNSGAQITKVLQFEYGEDVPENNQRNTLTKWVKEHPDHPNTFLNALLAYGKINKAYGIYVGSFSKLQAPDWKPCYPMTEERRHIGNNVIYSSFKTNTTATGRTSSGGGNPVGLGKTSQINIQNVPRDGGLRKMFVSRPGFKLAYADYGQIEMRVLGAYAKEEAIVEACMSSDLHGAMAAKVFHCTFEEIMAEDEAIKKAVKEGAKSGTSRRTKAKSVNFGIAYGMEAAGLAERLGCSVEEAQGVIDDYFRSMPNVKKFIDDTHDFVTHNQYVRTVFGRIRTFDNLSTSTMRESVNTLIQATASDIFQYALQAEATIFKHYGLYGKYVFPWAEVHDANTWEYSEQIPDDEMRGMMEYAMTEHVRRIFPQVDDFLWKMPLAADCDFTYEWH